MASKGGVVIGLVMIALAVLLINFVTVPSALSGADNIANNIDEISEGEDIGANVVDTGINIITIYLIGYLGTGICIILLIGGIIAAIKL